METLSEYATVKYFGVATFATGIFRSWYVLGDENSSFYLSSMLLILVFLIIYFEQYTRGELGNLIILLPKSVQWKKIK